MTSKQRAFVEAFLGPAKGNATKAALIVGCPRRGASTTAWRWLRKAEIQAAISAKVSKREKHSELSNEQIDKLLVSMAQDGTEQGYTRLGALRELNRTRGRHSIKHVVEGTLTIEDYIEASRRPEAAEK